MNKFEEVIDYEGHPILLEKKPITFIKIPVNGDKLHESILLHPRYAVSKVKY